MKKIKFLDKRRLMKNATSIMSILITAILVFSSAVSATNIVNTQGNVIVNAKSTTPPGNMCTLTSQKSEDAYIEPQSAPRGERGQLTIYDNGMDYGGLGASQWDASFNFDPVCADDFILTDPGNLTIDYVYWRGGYWNGDPAPFDWNVTFWNDDGTGLAPGTEIVHYVFANADTHETLIEGTPGGSWYYDYWVELPTNLTVTVDTKYWISIQGIGAFPPQSGFANHETILNSEGLLKSVYFGFPNWTPWSVVSPPAKDFCFQLKKYIETQHDVGVNSINTPVSGPAAESFPVEATVENFANAETDVPIQMTIGKITGVTVHTLYEEDFEANNGGYTVTGGLWEWGTPTYGPSGAYSGSYCWGTDLDYYYTNNANAKLDSVPITIPGGATLSFWSWFYCENYYDGGNVKISTDGGSTFTILGSYLDPYNEDAAYSGNAGIPGEPCFSGSGQNFWQERTFDLSAYVGETAIIRWHFGSDSSVYSYPGWFIDDVKITYEEYGMDEEYNETVLVDLAVGQVLDVPFSDWEPDDWQVAENVDIDYVVEAIALLPGDEIPDNDQLQMPITLSYPFLHDIEVTSINAPPLRNIPAQTLPVEVTIKNVGQFPECCYKTNVQIGYPQYIVNGWFSPFEADDGGLTASGDPVWEWGEPTSGPGAAYSGSKLWATNLGGNYPMCFAHLDTPAITVPVGGDLIYWHWYDTEASYDGYNVKISTDGGTTWSVITPIGGYTGTANSANPLYPDPCFTGHVQGYWEEETFDLAAYEGMSVKIRFDMGADSSVFYPGAYIDDVLVGDVAIVVVPEYDEDICTIVLDPGESADLIFPDWTPADLSNYALQDTSIAYTIKATAENPDDTNPANDQIVEDLTLDYFHDVKVTDITSPSRGGDRAIWDIQHQFDVYASAGELGNTGAEWDGTYLYSCVWSSSDIHQFDDTGVLLKTFTIAGVSALRDLAHDGTYLYGGAAGGTIFEMDPINEVLISSITGGFTCRAIAYNDDDDTFFVSNWADPVWEVDRTGAIVDSFNLVTATSTYGFAYDNICDDGPYLWVFDQDLAGVDAAIIKQWDLTTGAFTGVTHDVAGDIGYGSAGGLFFADDYVQGFATLGCLDQGGLTTTPDMMIMYEICETGPPGPPTPDIFIQPGAQSIASIVENAGVFPESGMNVNAKIYEYITNATVGTIVYDENYTCGTLDPLGGQETATFPAYTFPDIAGVYRLKFTITLTNDDYPDNNEMDLGIGVDNVPPTSQHTLTPATPDGLNGWYVSDVTVDFTADDGTEVWQSGVDHIEYKVNGGSWQTGNSVTVTTDGEHTVQYKAIDKVGNEETPNSVDFKMDKTVPDVDLTWESPDNVHVDFTAECSDPTSGMDYVEFYLNGGLTFTDNEAPFEWSIVWSPSLKNAEFVAKAFDMAGNWDTDMETGIEAFPYPHATPNPSARQTNPLQ